MRSDMAKLITECYRTSGGPYKKHRSKLKHELRLSLINDDYDFLCKRESIIGWAVRSWNNKDFGENLAPLKRFLLGSIGKLWSDVHSEMAEHISYSSTVQRHIWEHVFHYVEEKTFIEDEKVYFYDRFSYGYQGSKRVIEDSYAIVYICPETFVLKAVPPRKKLPQREDYKIRYLVLDKDNQAHWIFGEWYKITLAKTPEPYYINTLDDIFGNGKAKRELFYPSFKDVATEDIKNTWNAIYGMSVFYQGYNRPDDKRREVVYGIKDVYAIKKKQINKREKRKLGLK